MPTTTHPPTEPPSDTVATGVTRPTGVTGMAGVAGATGATGTAAATQVTRRHAPAVVVFDLGNVLIRWDPVAAIAREVGEEQARAFVADAAFDFMGWNHHQDAGRDWEVAESEAISAHPHWQRHILSYRRHFPHSLLGPVDGTAEVVEELAAAGVRLFGLTNWSAELYPHAPELFPVLGRLEEVVVSGREGLAKPDPAIFTLLAQRMGLPLTTAVLVDDSPRNVSAAEAAGMHGVLFTGAAQLRQALADRGLPVRAVAS